jgi:hypothetical protein
MQQGVDSQRAGAAETHELRLANAVLTRDVEQLCQQIGMKKVPVAIGNWRAQAGPEIEEMVSTRPPPAHTRMGWMQGLQLHALALCVMCHGVSVCNFTRVRPVADAGLLWF